MKISELRLSVGRNGELVIPSEILQGMGLLPLDSVYMAYLTKDGLKNEYHGKLYQFDLEGNFLNCFSTTSEAAKAIGKEGYGNNITRCIHGHRKTSYGYIWKSEEQVQRLSQACEYTQVGGNGENPTCKKED